MELKGMWESQPRRVRGVRIRKSDTSAAFYEAIEAEARIVRMVFEIWTQQGLSIIAIARLLNERQIATRTRKGRWERSTVWGMLRNPAYRGTRMLWQDRVAAPPTRDAPSTPTKRP